jgi:hypothetical protein
MKVRYEWRQIENGLLLDPPACGPYYDTESINSAEMNTKEQALERYKSFRKTYQYSVNRELVLIEIYQYED